MGDKSPKSTNKRVNQKQIKSNQAKHSKQVSPDVRRMIPPKK